MENCRVRLDSSPGENEWGKIAKVSRGNETERKQGGWRMEGLRRGISEVGINWRERASKKERRMSGGNLGKWPAASLRAGKQEEEWGENIENIFFSQEIENPTLC